MQRLKKNGAKLFFVLMLLLWAVLMFLYANKQESETELQRLYSMQSENMEKIMYVKEQAYIASQEFIHNYKEYKRLKKVNEKIYEEILSIVNSWSTNQPLDSVKSDILGLSKREVQNSSQTPQKSLAKYEEPTKTDIDK